MPSIEQSVETCKRLAAQVGKEKIAWRYDPVLLTGRRSQSAIIWSRTERGETKEVIRTYIEQTFGYDLNGMQLVGIYESVED